MDEETFRQKGLDAYTARMQQEDNLAKTHLAQALKDKLDIEISIDDLERKQYTIAGLTFAYRWLSLDHGSLVVIAVNGIENKMPTTINSWADVGTILIAAEERAHRRVAFLSLEK